MVLYTQMNNSINKNKIIPILIYAFILLTEKRLNDYISTVHKSKSVVEAFIPTHDCVCSKKSQRTISLKPLAKLNGLIVPSQAVKSRSTEAGPAEASTLVRPRLRRNACALEYQVPRHRGG